MARKSFSKKLAFLCATLMLTASLSACGSKSKETAKTDEKPYEVVMEIVTMGQEMKDISAVEEAINKISLKEINCTVKLLNVGIPDHAQKTSLLTASGTKVDLLLVGTTTNVASLATSGVLNPIDDLLKSNGKDILTLMDKVKTAGVVNGKTYAISADAYPAQGRCLVFSKEIADKDSIVVPENATYSDLEKVFQIIKEKEKGMYGWGIGNGSLTSIDNFIAIDSLGDSAKMSNGVVINPTENTKVENLYATNEYKEYITKLKEWRDKGYIQPDAATSGVNGADLLKTKIAFMMGSGYDVTQEQVWNRNLGFPVNLVKTLDQVYSTKTVQEIMWGIPVTSEKPEKAMDFLNLMYKDADIANLLNNGIEGKEYKKVSDNIITYADGVDAKNIGYSRLFSKFGDTMKVKQWQPATEDFYKNLKSFNDGAKNTKTLGYIFDPTNVKTEITAISNVIDKYRPAFETGTVSDIDGTLNKFLSELDTAGMKKVVEENQKQLDTWLKTQK